MAATAVDRGSKRKAPGWRRPFALFCAIELQKSGGATTMKDVAACWHALSPTHKEEYKQKSKEEHTAWQRDQKHKAFEAKVKVARPSCAINPSNAGGGSVPSADAHAVKFGIYTLVQGVPALGKGSYGQVFRVADPTGHVLAAKVFKDAAECSREVTAYRKIASARFNGMACPAHFLELIDCAATAPLAWIIFPIAEGGCLGKHMSEAVRGHHPRGRFPAAEAHLIIEQAWSALHFLHMYAGILHMDVKPNNMIWSRAHERLVVVDFSLVEPWPVPVGHEPHGVYCSLPYRPPEIMAKVKRTMLLGHVRPAIDWWALGCVVWELATGHARFSGEPADIDMHVNKFHNQPKGWLPQTLTDLLQREVLCLWLDPDPALRESAPDFVSFRHQRSHLPQRC